MGPATRAKLNKLYGCKAKVQQPSATTTSATSSLVLISPNGGEQLTQGAGYYVKWNALGLEKVSIILINYSTGDQLEIGSASATLGKYFWTVPSSIISGDKYKISVKSGKIVDSSNNYFSITAVKKSLAPFLTLFSPLGGEQWEKGKIYSIRWLFQDIDKIDTILLYNYAQNKSYSLANNIGATFNSFDWQVPLASQVIPAGDKYKIKIKSCINSTCYSDESDNYFSILPAGGGGAIKNWLADISKSIQQLLEGVKKTMCR